MNYSIEQAVVPDVSLADQNTCMVNGLGQAQLGDQGLETAFHEVLNLQSQHFIKCHFILVQYTQAAKAT